MALVAQHTHASLLEAGTTMQRTLLHATSGPVSGLWLVHARDSNTSALASWAFRIALRCRFGMALFLADSACCLKAADAEGACGKTLDQAGVHSTTCNCGGYVMQFHDCVKEVVRQAHKAAGHFACKVQVVPQWGRWVRKRRRRRADHLDGPELVYEEAVLDVVSFDPASLQHY